SPREVAAYMQGALGQDIAAQRECVRAWLAQSETSMPIATPALRGVMQEMTYRAALDQGRPAAPADHPVGRPGAPAANHPVGRPGAPAVNHPVGRPGAPADKVPSYMPPPLPAPAPPM